LDEIRQITIKGSKRKGGKKRLLKEPSRELHLVGRKTGEGEKPELGKAK